MLFRSHWKFPIKRAKPLKVKGRMVARGEEIPRAEAADPNELQNTRDWIRSSDPTAEQIEQRAAAEQR